MSVKLNLLRKQLDAARESERLMLLLDICKLPEFQGTEQELEYLEEAKALASVHGNKESLAECILLLAIFYRKKGDYMLASENARSALQFFEDVQNKPGMIRANNTVGHVHYLKGNYAEALKIYSQSLALNEALGDKGGIARSYDNIGNVYAHQGLYAESLKYLFMALALYEETADKRAVSVVYAAVGNNYLMQGDYSAAIKYLGYALEMSKNINDKLGICDAYNNIGVALKKQGNHDEALKNYFLSLQIAKEIGNKRGISYCYSNIGNIYGMKGDYTGALKNHLLSLEIDEKIANKKGKAYAYGNIGVIYEMQGKYDEAIKYYLLSLRINEEIGEKDAIAETARLLTNTYRAMGNFENALKYHEKYHALDKEMLGEEAQKQLTNLNFQHNMEQKERESEIERLKNVELKQALEKLKVEKSRSEQLFHNQLQDLKSSALQAQMNPHFVFNSLNSIQQFIWEKNPAESTAYLNKFSKLIRGVLDNSRRQYVTLEQDLDMLSSYVALEALRFEDKFEFNIIPDASVNVKEIQLPPMIIQPFVENAILHGLFPLKKQGKLTVSIHREGSMLQIRIEDNGVGRARASEYKMQAGKSHQSVAMQLTRERLEKLNSDKIDVNAIVVTDLYDEQNLPAGTKVEINIPLD